MYVSPISPSAVRMVRALMMFVVGISFWPEAGRKVQTARRKAASTGSLGSMKAAIRSGLSQLRIWRSWMKMARLASRRTRPSRVRATPAVTSSVWSTRISVESLGVMGILAVECGATSGKGTAQGSTRKVACGGSKRKRISQPDSGKSLSLVTSTSPMGSSL